MMNINKGTKYLVVILGLFISSLLISAQGVQSQLPERAAITNIELQDLPQVARVLISTSRPVKYKSFDLEDPPGVRLFLPGGLLTWKEKKLIFKKGLIKKIEALQYSTRPDIVQINVYLAYSTNFEITSEEKLLTLEIAKVVKPVPKEINKEAKRHYKQGKRHYEREEFEQAISSFEKALDLNPKLSKARNYIVRAREGMREREKKIALVLEGTKEEKRKEAVLEKKDAQQEKLETCYEQGKRDYHKGNLNDAIGEFVVVLTIDSEHKGANKYLIKTQNKLAKAQGSKGRPIMKAEAPEGPRRTLNDPEGQAYGASKPTGEVSEKKALYQIENVEVSELLAQTQVTIISDKQLRYSSFILSDPPRLIVDFPDTRLEWKEKELMVGKEVLSKIRSGQFSTEPPIIRIVLDLNQMVKYDIIQKDNRITVALAQPLKAKPKAPLLLSMDFKDADIGNVLRMLSIQHNLNIIISDEVKGAITVHFTNVTLKEALDAIIKVNGFDYIKQNSVIWVIGPKEVGKRTTITRIITLNYADVSELKDTLAAMLSKGGKIQADKRASALIVTDIPRVVKEIEWVVKKLDSETPQIMMEAKIVEVSYDALRELGFRWGGATPDTRYFETKFTEATLPVGETDFQTLTRSAAVVSAALDILEDEGKAKVLSDSRIATINNEPAKILIGDRIPIEVREVIEGTVVTEIQWVEAGIKLRITPQVNPEGGITTKIHTEVSTYTMSTAGGGYPIITTREAESTLRVKDGETVLLGGLLKEEEKEKLTKVPGLGHIPGLGVLFTRKKKEKTRTEIVIFVTPHLLTREVAERFIKEGEKRIEEMEKKKLRWWR